MKIPDGRVLQLSPLLFNIVLDELEWDLDRRGLRFVRCDDDFSIFVRSERSGHRVMGSITKYIEHRLRLAVNADKSRMCGPPVRFCERFGGAIPRAYSTP
jgi:RNA-directed DNA polymerase